MPKKKTEMLPDDEQLSRLVDNVADSRAKSGKSRPSKEAKKEKKRVAASERQLRKKSRKLRVPKTVQDTIPYKRVYPDSNIIEIMDQVFCRAYLLTDINYHTADKEEQETLLQKYGEFLNSFEADSYFQICNIQEPLDVDRLLSIIRIPAGAEAQEPMRQEMNQILEGMVRKSNNGLVKTKLLVVRRDAATYEEAKEHFQRLDQEVSRNIRYLGSDAVPITAASWLELLHDIYNPNEVGLFGNNCEIQNGKLVFKKDRFDFNIMQRMGLTTKDVVAPSSFSFQPDHCQVGDQYCRILYIHHFPSDLKDEFLKDLMAIDAKMVVSMNVMTINPETAAKMVKNAMRNANAGVIQRQRRASREGYSADVINPEHQELAIDANTLREDLANGQKLFKLTFTISVMADTKELLDSKCKAIQSIGTRNLVTIRTLNYQQENALASTMPLCNNRLSLTRGFSTGSLISLMPFVSVEMMDETEGIVCGLNAITDNLVMIDRTKGVNGNCFILGTPGSGKSVFAKYQAAMLHMCNRGNVIIIDPDAEYAPLAKSRGGEVITISPDSNVHINPFDIDLSSDVDSDKAVSMKVDFIISLISVIDPNITPAQHSLIGRLVNLCYVPYINSYDPQTRTYDQNLLPTLKTFYELLLREPSYEALHIAQSMEIYAIGSMDMFAHHTNVELTNSFLVFDISDIGSAMRALGQLVMLDHIWNLMGINAKKGINTYFFIDEIHLLLKTQYTASFISSIFKRCRKRGGYPTGITQNISDITMNDDARTIISNCEHLVIMKQQPTERSELAALLEISQAQLEYVLNAEPGHGIIYSRSKLIPFYNDIPKDTLHYRVMTTKVSEVAAINRMTEEKQSPEPQEPTSPAFTDPQPIEEAVQPEAEEDSEEDSEDDSDDVSDDNSQRESVSVANRDSGEYQSTDVSEQDWETTSTDELSNTSEDDADKAPSKVPEDPSDAVSSEPAALNWEQFLHSGVEPTEYTPPEESGTFHARLICKRWGKKQNMIVYLEMENGRKYSAVVYRSSDYCGLDQLPMGCQLEVIFTENASGRIMLTSAQKIS